MCRPPQGRGIVAGLYLFAVLGLGQLAARAVEAPVLLSTSNREGSPKLYIVDPDTGASRALHEPQGSESLASWSPDGTKIAFCSSRSGNHDIWLMDADGGNVRQLTTDPAPDFVSTWSPDGKKIAFTTARTGDEEIL
jgi:Tol biopolymer transport system component